ncbi:MAG: hypothetical protein IJL09_04320 [Lachnospiraceae bacterium]|nr:hypothetical protein [Lachnospiraceae bacterium]
MKRYQVSRGFKYALIVAATGLALLFVFLMELVRFRFPKKIGEFSLKSLRNNQYVSVTANECVPGKGNGNATNSEYISPYNVQPVPSYRLRLGEEAYVDVVVEDAKTISELESWPEGKGGENYVTVVAKVIKEADRLLLYQTSEEHVRDEHHLLFFFSGMILVAACLMFLTVGRISTVYEKPFEDSKRYKEIFLGQNYHLEEELVREKALMEHYQEEQKEINNDIKRGILIIVGSLLGEALCFLFMTAATLDDALLAILGTLATLVALALFYVFLWGLKYLWNAYINSSFPSAHKISELFCLRTISVRREESSKLIGLITRKLEEQKQKEKDREQENKRLWLGTAPEET